MKLLFLNGIRHRRPLSDTHRYKLIAWVILAFWMHVFAFMYFEGAKFFDSFWLSFTTIMTVGYGDIAAKTVGGRLSTIILLYIGGIFVMAKLAGDFFNRMYAARDLKIKGKIKHKMKNHIVIINHPNENPELFLKGMIQEIRTHADYEFKPIVLISPMEELPNSLHEILDFEWVCGKIHDKDVLDKASVLDASDIIILSDTAMDVDFDSYAFDIVDYLKGNKCKGYVISEAVKPESKERLLRIGADAVIKVMHGYPCAAARALTVKGSQEVLENLFSNEGEECMRFDLRNSISKRWNQLVIDCMNKDIGMPIACITTDNKILTSPINKDLEIKTLFIITNGVKRNNEDLYSLLK